MQEIINNKEQKLNEALRKEEKGFFGFFIKHFRFTYLILIFIVAFGFFALFALPREADPEVKVPIAVVTTVYPGASPADVEELITDKIEEKIKNVENLNRFTSNSGNGISNITVEFLAEADLTESFDKLKDEVDKAKVLLPEDAEDPVVTEIRMSDFPIVTYNLTGDISYPELKKNADRLESEIETMSGVSKVEMFGGQDREYQVILDQTKVQSFGIPISRVVAAISLNNLNFPVGDIEVGGFNYSVRLTAKDVEVQDLEKITVATIDGSPIFLRDLGVVQDTFEERISSAQLGLPGENSRQSISLQVYKKTGGNIVDIVKVADENIDQFLKNGEITSGVQVIKTNDNSVYIKESLGILTNSAFQTMVLILVLLLLVLGFRSALITAISLPVAFLMSFIWLHLQGETLNSMVLFALVLSLGLMVDNSIVVIEGFVEYMTEHKKKPYEAAVLSVWNYKWPIIAGTLTTVSAFLPMLLVSGIMGEYMGILPKTLTATLISSLFVALIIIPTLASRLVKNGVNNEEQEGAFSQEDDLTGHKIRKKIEFNFIGKIIEKIKPKYTKILQEVLPYKKKRKKYIRMSGLLFVVAIIILSSPLVKVEMFPSIDMRYFQVSVELPAGSALEKTEAVVSQVENIVKDIPELESYVSTVGAYTSFYGSSSSNSHLASVVVNLVAKEDRKRKSPDIAASIRGDLEAIDGAKVRLEELSAGPPTGAPLEVRVFGNDLEGVSQVAQEVLEIVDDIEGTLNTKTSLENSAGEFAFTLDKQRANYFGLDAATVASQIRQAIYGVTATTISIDGEDVDVVAKYNKDDFDQTDDLKNLIIVSATGQQVSLSQVADLKLDSSLSSISHRDGKRIVSVTADLEKGANLQNIIKEFELKKQEIVLGDGYGIQVGGETEDVERSFREIFTSMIVAIILIAAILVLQFNSFKKPFIIIFTVPLAIIGVVVGLLILRLPFSLPAFIGIVSLAGIVVNDAIVLIDKIDKNMSFGMDKVSAAIEAGQARMQPIFLTSFTTIAGIFPLTFADEMWKGLGWTVIFGLLFSTFLTLVIVPILFVGMEKGSKPISK